MNKTSEASYALPTEAAASAVAKQGTMLEESPDPHDDSRDDTHEEDDQDSATGSGRSSTTNSWKTPLASTSSSAKDSAPKKKRRRSRKGLAKVFECTEPSCGKRFTRQEHLARHQLNHRPKMIYRCSWPDCGREFVREDLRLRHYNRHLRRNGPIQNSTPAIASTLKLAENETNSSSPTASAPVSATASQEPPQSPASSSASDSPATTPSLGPSVSAAASSLPSYETLCKQQQALTVSSLSKASPVQQITDFILPSSGSSFSSSSTNHNDSNNSVSAATSSTSETTENAIAPPSATTAATTTTTTTTKATGNPSLPFPWMQAAPSTALGPHPPFLVSPISSNSAGSFPSHTKTGGLPPPGRTFSNPTLFSHSQAPILPAVSSSAAGNSAISNPSNISTTATLNTFSKAPAQTTGHFGNNSDDSALNMGSNISLPVLKPYGPSTESTSQITAPAEPTLTNPTTQSHSAADPTPTGSTPIFNDDALGIFNPLYSMSPTLLFTEPEPRNDQEAIGAGLGTPAVGMGPGSPLNTNDLISWLFSDALLQNVRDPVLSPAYPTTDSPMALQNMLAPPVPSTQGELISLSESKRQRLLQLIPEVVEPAPKNEEMGSEEIKGLELPPTAGTPVGKTVPFYLHTTLPYLQKYIANYWIFFHTQYPILHRPTFAADRCPEGLLWVLVLIGATYDRADEFARRVADPLRWILFGSPEFDPPAKLWVIQALILLEMYEKSMTNRKLHIRGHIHHGSILQLIRRGPMLTGSSMADTDAAQQQQHMQNQGGLQGSQQLQQSELDPWKRWIQFEETKRSALLAFVLDTNHANLFGHTSLLAVHELRVSLPCSKELWECSDPVQLSAYFAPSQNGLGHNQTGPGGVTTVPFIDALKMTLNNIPVPTEPFGRKVILSGLLSIQYNMQQRDLQVTSLGWDAFRGTWRDLMRKAYMFWRNDYKTSLIKAEKLKEQMGPNSNEHIIRVSLESQENANKAIALLQRQHQLREAAAASSSSSIVVPSEPPSRFALEVGGCTDPFLHLAMVHMSVSQLDLQYFCGAPSIFNNSLKTCDYAAAERRIRAWVNMSSGGPEALHFAVHFLKEMYLVEHASEQAQDVDVCPNPYIVPTREKGSDGPQAPLFIARNPYIAANDPIPHRPFIVFICAMVVWTYGYVLQGPESRTLWIPPPPLDPSAGPATPKSLGEHVFKHMRGVPHQRDGLEYIAWLAQETSRAMAQKGGNGSGSGNSNGNGNGSSSTGTGSTVPWQPPTGPSPGRRLNQTVGFLKLVVDSLHNHHWELVNEGERLLINCLERSLGKTETKCHYLRWEC